MTFGAYMMTMSGAATFDVTGEGKKETIISRFFKRMIAARQQEVNKMVELELEKFRVRP